MAQSSPDLSQATLTRLFPREHLSSLLASGVRVDRRAFAACRDMQLSSGIVHAVLSSASISIGRTVVIAGVQAAPVTPDSMHPTRGFFGVNIDLGPACGERFRLGKPSDYACALSMHVHDALVSCGATEFINEAQACIQSGMIVWRFTMNLVVIVADGNLFDACLIAASAAISNVCLPLVEVAPSGAVLQRAGFTPLLLPSSRPLPLSLTFALVSGALLVDPCASEEDCSDGMITVVIFAADSADVDNAPLSVRLHGGAAIDAATIAAALQSARLRAKQIVSTLNSLSKR